MNKECVCSRLTICLLMLLTLAAYQGAYSQVNHLADYVNPYIGSISPKTGGTSPTVLVPHGMLEVSPRFTPGIGDEYLADKIYGFPIGAMSVMATSGPIQISPQANASSFDHDLETSKAYYYQALLMDPNIDAEYTVTSHAIIFRFTFPASSKSNILLNVFHDGELKFDSGNALEGRGFLEGYRNSIGLRHGRTFYYYAEFSKPPVTVGTWRDDTLDDGSRRVMGDRIGAYAVYATTKGEQIEIKVGVSDSSVAGARNNLSLEMPDWDFEQVRVRAMNLWNKALGLIEVEGGTRDQLVTFYTALYRNMGRKSNVGDAYRCAYPLIQSAMLDGRPLEKPWFSHQDVVEGGTLLFEMGPLPNKSWGSRVDDTPPSMSSPEE